MKTLNIAQNERIYATHLHIGDLSTKMNLTAREDTHLSKQPNLPR